MRRVWLYASCWFEEGDVQGRTLLIMIDQYQMQSDQREQEWIADTNEKTEASEATTIVPEQTQPTEAEQPIYQQIKEPVSEIESLTQKRKESLDQTLTENVCIDNSNVVLVGYIGRKIELEGRLKVTNIKVVFYTQGKNDAEVFFDIPVGYLLRADRSEDKLNSYVQIHLKYGTSMKIKYSDQKSEISAKTQRLIAHLIETSHQLAYEYGTKTPIQLKCLPFCPVRCENVSQAHWYDNEGWKRLLNYPQKFRVPLPYLSKNSAEDRLVVLSFVYNNGRDEVALWRTGSGRPDPSQEEWMAKAKNNPKIYTFEIKNKGIGSARSQASKMIEMQSLSQLRQSFFSIFRLAANNHESAKWIAQLMPTKWYEQVGILLQEASQIVNQLMGSSVHVTVLADSEVRAAQLVALCQILLFPECRSIKGFGELVERQFLQWGGTRSTLKKDGSEPDRGSALIQFLDAVFQLTSIYPLSFQFSQGFLLFLAEQIYSNRFGNFLLVSKAIKEEERKSIVNCACIWKTLESWMEDPNLACYYLNPFYVDYKECDIYQLKQMPSLKQLKIWSGFFFKKFRDNNPDYHLFHRYNQLSAEHFKNKKVTEDLRKQLAAQYKHLQDRKALLNDLKAFE